MARNLNIPPLRERLLSKTRINWETGCWEWTAYRNQGGYGTVWLDGRQRRAHRVFYELFEGPIPEGLTLDHLCRVRHCVNPAHLEPVTIGENTRRAPTHFTVVNVRKTHCPRNHEYTPENTRISARGGRECRACAMIRSRERHARRKEAA